MFNTIKKIFGMEHEISSKIFRKALYVYPFLGDGCPSAYLSHITRVWATQKGNLITVHIKTHHPGILIGKAGSLISGIRSYMNDLSGKEVFIDIKEDDTFQGIYD